MMDTSYRKLFNPDNLLQDFREVSERDESGRGDRRDGKIYFYEDRIVLAINVALATGRPLLIQGLSGSGKSSVAFNAARVLKRKYYEFVVTSRTQAQELLWRYDAVRRLADAQLAGRYENAGHLNPHYYVEPGILWWVYSPASALSYGRDDFHSEIRIDPCEYSPIDASDTAAVVLIDEIDKADPDFPNSLLVALGSKRFVVTETSQIVELNESQEKQPLIIITTNGERQLPDAFLRRCVILTLENPSDTRLKEIAKVAEPALQDEEYETILMSIREVMVNYDKHRRSGTISIAEFLDVVRSYIELLEAASNNKLDTLKTIVRIILNASHEDHT